jgi:murein DD-endopeptidase MepM/ murein hydrolase activator NlpD
MAVRWNSPIAVVALLVAWMMIGVLGSLSVTTLADAVDDMETRLYARQLLVPVPGVQPALLRDTFNERRGDKPHEALDIMAPRGTPVMATDDGRVVKLFNSVPGGLTIYQVDMGNEVVYYYAHLDRYAEDLREGGRVRRGDIIGYVGTSGNAAPNAPHLHFAIFKLPPGKEWWKGTPINPLPLYRNSSAH